MEPRPYQAEAFDAARKANVVMVGATGVGKVSLSGPVVVDQGTCCDLAIGSYGEAVAVSFSGTSQDQQRKMRMFPENETR